MKYPLLVFFLSLIYVLPGCAKFKPAHFGKQANSYTAGICNTPSLTIKAIKLTDIDQTSTARAISAHIDFIQLTISNKSKDSYIIKPSSFHPTLLSKQELNKTIPQLYACYFIPAFICGAGGFLFMWHIGLPLAAFFTLFGIDQSKRAAQKTLTSITAHLFDNEEDIKLYPHSTKTLLLVVDKKQYTTHYSFIASNNSQKELCSFHLQKSTNDSFTLI